MRITIEQAINFLLAIDALESARHQDGVVTLPQEGKEAVGRPFAFSAPAVIAMTVTGHALAAIRDDLQKACVKIARSVEGDASVVVAAPNGGVQLMQRTIPDGEGAEEKRAEIAKAHQANWLKVTKEIEAASQERVTISPRFIPLEGLRIGPAADGLNPIPASMLRSLAPLLLDADPESLPNSPRPNGSVEATLAH